jgi:hypothetical protein
MSPDNDRPTDLAFFDHSTGLRFLHGNPDYIADVGVCFPLP